MRNPFARIPQPGRYKSHPGEHVKINYRGYYKDDGTVGLKEFDRIDIQKEINSYIGQCDLGYLMQRFSNGDTVALNQMQPMYGDFSNIPTNFVDLYNMVHGAEDYFHRLPSEIKQSFNNNPVEWFASMGNVDWFERMNPAPSVENSVDNVERGVPSV